MITKVFIAWLLLAGIAAAQEVNTDSAAYAFAKREAQIQASRERVGHFLGIAPG